MTLPTLGIDIAKKKFQVAMEVKGKIQQKTCDNTAAGFQDLFNWMKHRGVDKVHACMEATGAYGEALANALFAGGHVVSIVNPARIKGFAKSVMSRHKTDEVDAALICQFCEKMRPAPWTPPPAEVKELQALVRRLEDIEEMRQMEANRLGAVVASEAVTLSIQQSIENLDRAIVQTMQLIKSLFDQHAGLKQKRDLITSIPGIAEKTAAKILAEIPGGSVSTFESARELAAFAGQVPRQWTSGSSVRGRPRLSKMGSARLRKALYMPAVVAMCWNPVIRAFCERLAENGKAKKAIVCAAMRKLLHIVFGVLKSQRPFDPRHGQLTA